MYTKFWRNDPFFSALPGIAKTILTTSRYTGTLFKARIKSGMKLETGNKEYALNNWRHLSPEPGWQLTPNPLPPVPPFSLKIYPQNRHSGKGAVVVCSGQGGQRPQGSSVEALQVSGSTGQGAHVHTALQEFLL